ncbi:hypothetical protein CEXT_411 [Caerostris extrusa]|uniref:Uncharacterized protein n=1 Tax=Caerostris extrusa TaxID=172846 RepID=A0AAV4NHX4_CAEEX|nr:hypothetical protein CEXT_411 [Caerostris extrusa]
MPNQNLRFHSFLILCESAWKHFCRFPEQNFQCCVTAAECPDVFPPTEIRFLLHKLTPNFRAAASNSRKRWMSILTIRAVFAIFRFDLFRIEERLANYLLYVVWGLICFGSGGKVLI